MTFRSPGSAQNYRNFANSTAVLTITIGDLNLSGVTFHSRSGYSMYDDARGHAAVLLLTDLRPQGWCDRQWNVKRRNSLLVAQ